ncbi:Phage terminase-like protein, large subunit, contains N-terminal HTH domain [Rhodovulum sp. ES.010]|uniref:terminase large subunit n=1 Tax=Rhodovulum sp. ES.010 TaxID=1882821 RepID=UPI00092A7C31|nr:terminase TerL endonuclease subunit [Rhodovulum sp. ES.010]SIO36630.1 Phage terminase-like protein, large subunit, contains N-terminal HTH domain [Rhodovulum sp. ES.010]
MDPLDHPVSRYAIDVVEGRIVAAELVRLACERHLRDLEEGGDRGLWFDVEAANRVLNFAKMIRHTKGPMAGAPLALEPWQAFRHGSVFGWKQADGRRRFRSTYHQVAKKNGKTTDTAVPALYTQLFDGEQTPECYCAAVTRDQAGLLFEDLKRMVRASPALMQLMNVWRGSIETPPTNGIIKALSRDGQSADGINPHFAARDEVHRWTDRELAEVIVNSMLARSQPIDWAITTAGADIASVCGELRRYGEKVLKGEVADDSFFAFIAEPPADCDPADPVAWRMANPNFGVAFREEDFAQLYAQAEAIQGKMPNFRRLHLNLWTEGAQGWIARDVWDRGGQPFDLAMLRGRPAWAALDLSNTTDTTAIVVAVPVDGLIHLVCYTFLPEGPKGFIARAQTENREFVAWRDGGWLEVHRGGSIDEDAIVERIAWIAEYFDLRELAYDRWGMRSIVKALVARKIPLVEHGQGYASMSAPMKEFERRVMNGRLRHGGNPVLAWAVGNVFRDEDPAENIKPNKRRSTGRIDPAVAAIMAVGRAVAAEGRRKARDVATV